MIRTEIFVEGNKLDTNDEIQAVLTFSIDDIKDFSSRNTKYSKTIVVPGTNQNNFVFGNIFDVNVYNSYDSGLDNVGYNYNAAKAANCLVFVDRLQVFKGVIRILEVSIVNGVVEYECAVFGDLGGFIAAVADGELKDLDFSAYDHTFNATEIQGSWTDPAGSGYYYPLIDYGVTTDGINYDITNFRPALYIKEYLEKIFTAAGYTYSSAFFETDNFKKLILPCNQATLEIEVDTLFHKERNAVYSDLPTYNLPFDTDVTTAYVTGTSILTYGRTGNIVVQLTYLVDFDVVSTDANPHTTNVLIRKNGVTINTDSFVTSVLGSSGTNTAEGTLNIPLVSGDTLSIQIQNTTLPGGSTVDVTYALFKAIGTPSLKFGLAVGDTLPVNSVIPAGIKQIDLFKSIVNMFNLYVTEDEVVEKKLYIKPYIDFYDTTLANARDWTDKLDYSKAIKVKPLGELNYKTYRFKYKDDVDYWNDFYKKKFSQTYGERRFDTGLEFVKDTKTVELIFAPLVLRQYASTDRVVGAIYKETNGTKERYTSIPRIVYRAEANLACGTWYIKDGVTTLATLSTYPYAGHVDDPVDPTVDLLWGAPSELYYEADLYPVANLFNVYWDFYVSEITDKDSKLLTGYFKLSPVDIVQLDFSKFIFIGGQLYRLNKITDYNTLSPEVTRCELLNVIDIQ